MAGLLDLSPISICELEILTPLFRVPQRPQGCQKIHKNILEINLMSFCPKPSAKVEIKLKNLKNCKKILFFLSTVWLGLNRASILIPLLLITYLVNKQLRNHPEIARFRIYDFFSNLSTTRVWPNQAKSWKWVMFKTLLCPPTRFQINLWYTIGKYTWSAIISAKFFFKVQNLYLALFWSNQANQPLFIFLFCRGLLCRYLSVYIG